MKALIIVLAILLVLGGAAFIYGWVSLFIPPDTYCVGFSKTYGFDTFVTKPGKFSWRWERLIPTNFTLYKFKLEPVSQTITLHGDLPSAETYMSVLPNSPDFSFTLEFEITLQLKPESLPSLVKNQYLKPENIQDFLKRKSDEIVTRLPSELSKLENAENYYNPAVLKDTVENIIASYFPDIEILDFTVKNLHLPDTDLYRKAKEIYFSLLEAEKESRKRIIEKSEQQRIADTLSSQKQREQIDILREYGKLLSEYPILLKYLQLKEEGKLPDDIDNIPKLLEKNE